MYDDDQDNYSDDFNDELEHDENDQDNYSDENEAYDDNNNDYGIG